MGHYGFDNDGTRIPKKRRRRGKVSQMVGKSTTADVTVLRNPPDHTGKFLVVHESNTIYGRPTSVATPLFWVTADDTESSLLNLINVLPNSPRNFSNIDTAVAWAVGQGFMVVSPGGEENLPGDGLILHIDPEKYDCYPRTGTAVYDLSGTNNSTLVNQMLLLNDNSFYTDGTDDYVSTPNITIAHNQPWSISMWFKTNQWITNQGLWGYWSTTSSAGHCYFRRDTDANGNIRMRFVIREQRNTGWSTLSLYPGPYGSSYTSLANQQAWAYQKWMNITITKSTSRTYQAYLNGVYKTGATRSSAYLNNGLQLNALGLCYNGVEGAKWVGKTLVYDRELSADEVSQIYYKGPIETDSLVLAVDAGNLVSHESGSTSVNSMLGSTTGTLYNGTTFKTLGGGSWDFDGSNDYISFGNPSEVQFTHTNEFSLEAWFNPDALSGFKHIIGKTYANYRVAQNGSAVSFRLDANNLAFQTSGILVAGKWHHVVATWYPATKTARIYINGQLAATGVNNTVDWTDTSANFQLGNSPGESYYFNGKIAVGRVYDRTLTDTEILDNFIAHKGRFGL